MKTIAIATLFATLALPVSAHRIFDSAGNFLYDEHEVRENGCLATWTEMTCKNVMVANHLVRSTPEYQEGHFRRMEQARQAVEQAKIYAEAMKEAAKEAREERAVRAQELSAQAQAVQALNGPVQVKVNQSVSQSTTIFH